MTLTQHAALSLADAYREVSGLPEEVLDMSGLSSKRGRHLLNNLCSLDGTRYLEIGVWRGSTLISALYGNKPDLAVGIENYSEAPDGVREAIHANWSEHMSGQGVALKLFEGDAFTLDPVSAGISGITTYLYDGCHTRDAQYRAIVHYAPALADECVLIVDDYNWRHVREATQAAIHDLCAEVLFSAVLTDGLDAERRDVGPIELISRVTGLASAHKTVVHPDGWWNGVYLGVLKIR